LQVISAGQTHPGQRRQLNEDAWRIAGQSDAPHLWPQCGRLFAVADGMGGHAAGEVASQLALKVLFSSYYDQELVLPSVMRLEYAIKIANRAIYEQSVANQSQAGMGTTVVAAVVHDDWLTIASVGDSRAYLIRDGEARQITHDHSWVAEQIEAGVLTQEEARVHMYRSVVTRCVGHQNDIQVDTFELLLDPGDTVLLCSDGLSGQVDDEEIARVSSQFLPDQAAGRLIDLANQAGGPDNITVVIFQVRDRPQQRDSGQVETQMLLDGDRAGATEPLPEGAYAIAGPVEGRTPAKPESKLSRRVAVTGALLGLVLIFALAILAFRSTWLQDLLSTPTLTRTAPRMTTLTTSSAPIGAPTRTPTSTPTGTPTRSPTDTPTPTATATRTATPTATHTPTLTPTLTPTMTPTPLPTSGPQIVK
jgi:serine/threonine protein phosphatase PrpC